MQKWPTNSDSCVGCLGILLIVLSFITSLQADINANQLKFDPQSELFKLWQKPDAPSAFNVYIFNWTNPEDVNNPEIKPQFEEVGPYAYKMFTEKTDITWNSENQTITYRNLVNFEFDAENSVGSDSDIVTTINFVALSLASQGQKFSFLLQHALRVVFNALDCNIYVQKPIRQLLFEGYEDPILEVTKEIPFVSDTSNRSSLFGWFYGKNGTVGSDGTFNVRTSPDHTFGTLQNWNYESKTPYYQGHCADVQGSAGDLYPANLNPDHIQFFSKQTARTIQFNFEKNVDVKGISGHRFSIGPEAFDTGAVLEENKCFCDGECLPTGVFNLSVITNSPTFVSAPHFYLADSSYLNSVGGLQPDKEKHESYVTLEPKSGLQLDNTARVQINVLLQPFSSLSLYENVTKVMFPVLWYEKKKIVSDKLVSLL